MTKVSIGQNDLGKALASAFAGAAFPASAQVENRLQIPIVLTEARLNLKSVTAKDGGNVGTVTVGSADELTRILSTLAQLSFLRKRDVGFEVSIADAIAKKLVEADEEPKPAKLRKHKGGDS